MRKNPGDPALTAYLKTLSFERLMAFCDEVRATKGCRVIDLRDRTEVDA